MANVKAEIKTANVREVYEMLLKEMIESATERYTAYYMAIVEKIKANVKVYGDIEKTFRKQKGPFAMPSPEEQIARRMVEVSRGFCIDIDAREVKLDPDFEKTVAKMVKDDIDATFGGFVAKHVKKTDEIIKGRGVEVKGYYYGSHDAELLFTLEDGSRFNMKTKIVYKTSKWGTNFCQFPTTFHDAYTADGTQIKTPSEKKLKESL